MFGPVRGGLGEMLGHFGDDCWRFVGHFWMEKGPMKNTKNMMFAKSRLFPYCTLKL